jgi:hypothetical protein
MMIETGYWGPMVDGRRQWIRYTAEEVRIREQREDLRKRGARLFSAPGKKFG